jgi:carbamoyl-phosphate synthase small subunit
VSRINSSAIETDGWNLFLQDGTRFAGDTFGYRGPATGEIVFNTGMVGYPEALTDPSYRGQILVLTYPLIGNYGISAGLRLPKSHPNHLGVYESDRIQVAGLVVSEASVNFSHWNAAKSLSEWLQEQMIPALCGVDTRAITKHLRERGSLLGGIAVDRALEDVPDVPDPNLENLVSQVSVREPILYGSGPKRVLLVDCGCKSSIIRAFCNRGISVLRVPWDHDFLRESFDGIVLSNGPGDPKQCSTTISNVRKALDSGSPILGICLGHQLLALAAGANTYKMKFGHRGQNQPCLLTGTNRCVITSQNHGYAVDAASLSDDWAPWFTNANDGTNEGLRHRSKPFMSVQFHPEAAPGPVDSNAIFNEFAEKL